MELLLAAVASLGAFGDLQVASCFGADAVVAHLVGVNCVGDEVGGVVGVIFVGEVLLKMCGDVGGELLSSFEVVFEDEVLDESECFLEGGLFGFDFLDFEVEIIGDDIF